MKAKKKISEKGKPTLKMRDLTTRKDVKGGLGDIKGESTDDKHR